MGTPIVALSIKQPWAALLVHGLKTIEVRRWPTRRRGPVLIHAARRPDRRQEGWKRILTPEVAKTAELVGGIIGSAELTDCVLYRSADHFAADKQLHLNDPSWFQGPRLYGFKFAKMAAFDVFCPLRGKVLFFPVEVATLLPKGAAEG